MASDTKFVVISPKNKDVLGYNGGTTLQKNTLHISERSTVRLATASVTSKDVTQISCYIKWDGVSADEGGRVL